MDFDLDAANRFNATCDLLGYPSRWVVCPHCGKQAWRMPPHGTDPCPIIVQTVEGLGLRFDAERMASVRMGVHIEESTKALHQYLEERRREQEDL